MRRPLFALLGIACLFAASEAAAQFTQQQPLTGAAGFQPQSVLPSPFRCSEFTRNSDGTWSPLRPITIRTDDTTTTVGPGMSFAPGATFSGVDLGAVLNRQCIAH